MSKLNYSIERTQGDGMEIEKVILPKLTINNRNRKKSDNKNVIYKPIKHLLLHIHPQDDKFPMKNYLKPILQRNEKSKTFTTNFQYAKEPKFVPREPFKGAVTPILPYKKLKKHKISKNNIDIQVLVSQMTNLASTELQSTTNKVNIQPDTDDIKTNVLEDNKRLENEIKILKDTNEQLEKNLRFQTQVNSELKTLLVAAVGEDLEARVQLLTEDKLQLARALLNSAQHLSTHREQVEWLAGHCEVWRSKFLASSLMVDELARWKSVLTNQIGELQEAVKCLLEEHNQINVDAFKVWETLSTVATNCNIKYERPTAMHVVAVTKACQQIALQIALYLLGSNFTETTINNIEINTPGEVFAQKALTRINAIDNPKSAYNVLLSKSNCTRCNSQHNFIQTENN